MGFKLTDLFRSQPAVVAEAIKQADLDIPQGTPPQTNHTDLPVILYGNWNVPAIQNALAQMQNGQFNAAALLTESVLGDDSVQTALNGRVKGVTMRHIHAHAAKGDESRRYADLCEKAWKRIFTHELLDDLLTWSTFMGFVLCEVQWEMARIDGEELWLPRLKRWHPQYVYYDIVRRDYVAITQDAGSIWTGEDGNRWWCFAPWGQYRGWVRGALRGIAPLWMVRQYAVRDWARFSEVHGLPTKILKAPYQSNQADKARMFSQVRSMGSNTTVMLPQQGGQDGMQWALELMEAKDRAWEAFPGLADYCDRRMHLTIRGTNLTSEVQGGSYAAAQVHADEDSAYADSDSAKLCDAATSIFEMFLGYNFGASDMVPTLRLEPPDNTDVAALAQAQTQVMSWVKTARENGWQIDEAAVAERYDIPLLKVEAPEVTPEKAAPNETEE